MSSPELSNILLSSLLLCAITATLVLVFVKRKTRSYVRVAKVVKLFIYPVKSLAGIEVNQLKITKSGVGFDCFRDRSWMLIDENNRFISQRTEPTLALLKTSFHDSELWIDGHNMSTLKLKVIDGKQAKHNLIETKVWNESIEAIDCGFESQEWFSNFLQKPRIKLVQHNNTLKMRASSAERNQTRVKLNEFPIIFQDGSGVLVMNTNSINDLNDRLSHQFKVNHKNFRPNVLVDDCQPFEEDNWKYIRIRDINFTFLKPCERCVLTTIDPKTGVKDGVEPLKTLRKYRLAKGDLKKLYSTIPLFGINFGPQNEGSIGCGDDILAVNHQK